MGIWIRTDFTPARLQNKEVEPWQGPEVLAAVALRRLSSRVRSASKGKHSHVRGETGPGRTHPEAPRLPFRYHGRHTP